MFQIGRPHLPHVPLQHMCHGYAYSGYVSCSGPIRLGWDMRINCQLSYMEALKSPCPWGSIQLREKVTPHFQETLGLRKHITQCHIPDSEKCVKNLTKWLVRMNAYPVAYGGFSDVWNCELRGFRWPRKRVAVKAIRSVYSNEKEIELKGKAVQQELDVWAKLNHKNVLPLYGIADGFGLFPAFVCPWADNGTLSDYLEEHETKLDLRERLTLLGDIASGLQYLHSRNVVHGDLSGSNVLIFENGRACLSDFGLSTLIEQVSDTAVSGFSFPGNLRWAAPELVEGCRDGPTTQLSSPQADVYSFGSIMLQTLSGKLPFHGVQRVAQIVVMIARGERPRREMGWDGSAIPEVLWDFVEECWASPCKRPTSEQIVDFIARQLSKL